MHFGSYVFLKMTAVQYLLQNQANHETKNLKYTTHCIKKEVCDT